MLHRRFSSASYFGARQHALKSQPSGTTPTAGSRRGWAARRGHLTSQRKRRRRRSRTKPRSGRGPSHVGAQSQGQGWPQPAPCASRRPARRRWPARLAFLNPHCFFWSQRPLSSTSPQVSAEFQGSVQTPKAHAGQERGVSGEQLCKGLGAGTELRLQEARASSPNQRQQSIAFCREARTSAETPNPKSRTVLHSGVQVLHSQKGTTHVPQRPRWPSGHACEWNGELATPVEATRPLTSCSPE